MVFDDRQRQHLTSLSEAYAAKTRSSLARREAAWPALADARSSQGYFAEAPAAARELWLATRGLRHPIVAARSEGSRVWDLDGNEYLDFCMGFGVHLFGHRPHFIEHALRDQLARGLPIGFQADQAQAVAEAVARLTGAERVGFCNTGAEAIMAAIRLARAAHGRDRVAVFAGSYHGAHDAVVASIARTRGLSRRQLDDTLVLEYGADASLETIAAAADSLAAVIVEPVQARNPSLQPKDFLHRLRALTQREDIALIIDDILLGFRVHPGGSQAHFDLRADLATFGKIIGGGLPVGLVTGSARYLDAIDGGPWATAGEVGPRGDKIWLAGTFSKNPLTMAAAAAVCARLLAAGPELQTELNARTHRLCARINAVLEARALPVRLEPFASLFRLTTPAELWPIMAHLRLRGVYAFDGMTFFLSTTHGPAELEQFERALYDSLDALEQAGFFA
jgi:glutamate-1-semialdehyde aminotransferase